MSRHTRPSEEFFRLFYRPRLLPLPRPAAVRAAAAGADVAELVGGSVRTEGQSIDAGVFGTLFSVLKACGASESADHVWYEPGPLLFFAAKVTGASARGIFVLPTGEDARAQLLSAADAVLRQKASPE